MITFHESALQRVKDVLNERYYELEEKGVEMDWLKEYEKQTQIVKWLNEQTPDDE